MLKYSLQASLACTVFALFLFCTSTYAINRTVTRTDDRNAVSTCRNTGDCSLREAIGASTSGDRVVFSGGFGSPQTITLTGFFTKRLDVTTNITIQGPGANLLTVTGNNGDRVFEIFGGTNVSISGMTITGGNPQAVNFGSNGGGIIVKSGATLSLAGVTVTGNSAYDGGGIYVENGATLNATGITVNSNHSASIGGALNNDFGTVNVTNSTFSGNNSSNTCGGIYNNFGTITLTNSTVVFNNSVGVINAKGVFNVRNTILADNGPGQPDNLGGFASQGYNIVQFNGGSGFGAPGDLLGVAPQLGALVNNGGLTPTHYPACTSPAVEGGDPANPLAFDQRGAIRPTGLRVDIGAIETGCIVAVRDASDASANSLRAAVTAVDPGGKIIFDPAFFNVPRTIPLAREILISKSMTITGAGFVTISGSDFDRIFNIQGGTVNLSSLNLTSGNSGQGGAIYNAATAHLNGVTIYNSKGTQGGGIYNGGTMTVTNSTVSGNLPKAAGSIGGGIYNAGMLSLVNSTVANNSTGTGGGIYRNAGTVSVANTIISGNSATAGSPDVFGAFNSQGSNLVTDTTGATGFGASGDILGQSAQLSALANNGGIVLTQLPSTASPVINAGDHTLAVDPATNQALTTDQRGLSRSIVGVDIGATEIVQPVVTNNNNSGSGSLRLAITDSASSGTIEFSASFFSTPRTIALSGGQILIDKNLTVNTPAGLTIDANQTGRIFTINPNIAFNLNGGTLTRGQAPAGESGGAIANYGTTVLTNVSVTASSAPSGDGGGAIANFGNLDLTNSTLSGNSAQNGGGLANNSPSGVVNILNSTISGNAAANGEGGGIVNFFGGINLNGVTVAFNTATGAGGGVLNRGFSGNYVRPRNTIFANNTAGTVGNDIANGIDSQGYNIVRILNAGDGGGFNATDIVGTSANPVNVGLRPLAANGGPTSTHSLQIASAALNAADTSNYPATDQRGTSRPRGGRADIGAFESSTFVMSADVNAPEGLRSVLAAAIDGDTVTFGAPVFSTPQTVNLGGTELAITRAITIQGPGADRLTISGGNNSRIFSVAPGLAGVTINDLTITQGGNVPNGGGIFASSLLNLNRVRLTGNAAAVSGGAIYNNYQTINLNECTFSNNTVVNGQGGGIYSQNQGSGTPLVTGILNIRRTTFSGNQVSGTGGAVYNSFGTTRISNSTFSQNWSTFGGSAVYHAGSLPMLVANATFTQNTDSTGGWNVDASSASNGGNVINNSIVNGSIFGISGSHNLVSNGDDTSFVDGVDGNIVGTGANPINPMLGSLANNGGATQTHSLLTGSRARNNGNNSLAADPETGTILTADQRGYVRISIGGGALVPQVDIGAYEVQGPTAAAVSIGGRVTDAGGRGVGNAVVTLVDMAGLTRTARTNPFGYYSFDAVQAGQTYIVSVQAKRHRFAPQVVNAGDDLTEVNFVSAGEGTL